MIQPEDVTDRFHEMFPPPRIPAPVAGDGLAGRMKRQFQTADGPAQIKCELCPIPGHVFCSIECSGARRAFDANDNVKVT